MNPFNIVRVAAKDGHLAALPQAKYFASEEYQQRTEFKGELGVADSVQVQLYLLQHIALQPAEVETMRTLLMAGCVTLRFFGVSNPIPLFSVEEGGAQHQQLLDAFQANLSSRKFKAALRVLKWREWPRAGRRNRVEQFMRNRVLDENPWPSQAEWNASEQTASARYAEIHDKLGAVTESVRGRRNARLAILANATSEAPASGTDMLVDLSVKTLASTH